MPGNFARCDRAPVIGVMAFTTAYVQLAYGCVRIYVCSYLCSTLHTEHWPEALLILCIPTLGGTRFVSLTRCSAELTAD